MDSHIRVYIEANWTALRCLMPVAYKVLICLVQRADGLGRCFPTAERIAEDCDCHVDSVWRALEILEENRYIAYLRRNEFDQVTGRKLPNVYLVSPHFICIALEQQEFALNLWSATLSDFSGINQQQQPAPRTNTSKPTTETNNNNQRISERDEAGDAPQNEKLSSAKKPKAKSRKAESEKAKSKDDSETGESQQGKAPQRSKNHGRSAPAYRNPDAVPVPLPDALHEALATRINRLGIPMPLARGFVVGYGLPMVEKALLQLAAAKRTEQKISNDGGFFRYLLQNNLVDSSLPEILSAQSWADYSE